jgi:acetyl-CoA C-acetyltransferase
MGVTAENLAEKYQITRAEQDEYAVQSQIKASRAQKSGYTQSEIVPVTIPASGGRGQVVLEKDESIRHEINIEKVRNLKPAFKDNGTVTAGNACGMGDGACALVLTTRAIAKMTGHKPLFSIVSSAQTAAEPAVMGEGPGLSIPMALSHVGMSLEDMDFIEINEAFAVQMLANERMLKWDRDRVNIFGGAIALGHPTGISGARILMTLANILRLHDKELGVAAICGGGGVTTAMIVRRES